MKGLFLKSAALFLGVGLLASCSNDDSVQQENEETGTLAFTINFTKSSGSRSSEDLPGNTGNGSQGIDQAISTAIPETSWNNISSLQLFLYDRLGVIYFSDYIDAHRIRQTLNSNASNDGSITYTYGNVPAGYYFLSVVANTDNKSQRISTTIHNEETTWDKDNVINQYIYDCKIRHKRDAFPLFYQQQVAASNIIRNETAYAEPSEIFLGEGHHEGQTETNMVVTVENGKTAKALVNLKREVSMMRLRVDLAGDATKTNNAGIAFNPDGKVDFSRNATIMIATLPECIYPMVTTTSLPDTEYKGGTSEYCSRSAVLVTNAVDGTRHFHIANPTTGYSENGKIIGIENDPYNANAWRDIIVMPNANKKGPGVLNQNRYLLIISALGLPGHITKNGPLTEEKTIYWVGYINEPFEANKIREVNVIFRDGGTEELPERPDNVGNLEVTVSEPKPWDSNVQASEIQL